MLPPPLCLLVGAESGFIDVRMRDGVVVNHWMKNRNFEEAARETKEEQPIAVGELRQSVISTTEKAGGTDEAVNKGEADQSSSSQNGNEGAVHGKSKTFP